MELFGHQLVFERDASSILVDGIRLELPIDCRIDYCFRSDSYPGSLCIIPMSGPLLYVKNPTHHVNMWVLFWNHKELETFPARQMKELNISGSVL